ncbi:MAG: AAA family ATPase [Pseudomonadota bacterium]
MSDSAREQSMAHVYISHSPVDLDPLLELHEALRQAGIAAWYPPSPIAAKDNALVRAKIDQAFAMIVLVSADGLRSEDVQRDVAIAQAQGIKIVPLQLDRARMTGSLGAILGSLVRHHADTDGGQAALIEELRRLYRARCPVLAVMNLKGGVGKTTISAQVFGALQAIDQSRVLLVDLDPQYNLTQVFFDMEDADARAARDASVISLFEKSTLHANGVSSPATDWRSLSREPFTMPPESNLIHSVLGSDGPSGRFDIVTGQFEISKYAFATDPIGLAAIKTNFLNQIEALRSRYDLIVFDTNPNATFLTRCALEAADRVLAPMHPDIYSLRGVRLLSQVIKDQVAGDVAPDLSVVFNGVQRREQSVFEADARNGVFDTKAGFALSHALLGTAIPRSGHFLIREPESDTPQWHQLIVHHGRGGGLKVIRDALGTVAKDIKKLDDPARSNSQQAA